MTQKLSIYLIAFSLLITLCFGSTSTRAQERNNENVKTLGDILNDPKIRDKDDGKPLTSMLMANKYYKNCVNKKSAAFTEYEEEILCGCNAARLSEIFTVEDFKNLEKDTKKGKNARARMLSNAYAPCMEYVMKSKTERDCFATDYIKKQKIGKKNICNCVIDKFETYSKQNAAYMITQSMYYEPMSIDPLEYFFTSKNYMGLEIAYLRQCAYSYQYAIDNQ